MSVRPDYTYDIAGVRDTNALSPSLQDRRRAANKKQIILPNRNHKLTHPDVANITVTWNAAADPSYNNSYAVGAGPQPNPAFPGLMHSAPRSIVGGFSFINGSVSNSTGVLSTETDGQHVAFNVSVPNLATSSLARIYVDGYFVSEGNLTINGSRLITVVFNSIGRRRVDLVTSASIGNIYTKNPHRAWKPVAEQIVGGVVGDSYSIGVTSYAGSLYPRLFTRNLGILDFVSDSVAGTGYLQAGTSFNYLDRLNNGHNANYFPLNANPAFIIGHGGGSNDFFNGQTIASVADQIVKYFRALATKYPDSKLIFMEGFAPPAGFSGFNPSYVQARQAAQSRLFDVGVYYIDVATTLPWLYGTGRVGAVTGDGNADLYVTTDGIHLSQAGDNYVADRLDPLIRKICLDTGDLVDKLVA